MKIRIYLDGTFESLSASYSFATDKERRDRIKVLQGDLKLMDKVEALRVTREANKKTIAGLPKGPQKEKARAKDKEILGKIKELKAKLTSPRHSSSKIIGGMIRQTMDTVVGGKTIGQIAKEAGIKPGSKKVEGRNPITRRTVKVNADGKKPLSKTSNEAGLKIQNMRLQKAYEKADQDAKTAAPRTEEKKAHLAKRKKIQEMMAQSKEGVEFSKAELGEIAPVKTAARPAKIVRPAKK